MHRGCLIRLCGDCDASNQQSNHVLFRFEFQGGGFVLERNEEVFGIKVIRLKRLRDVSLCLY